MSEKRTTFGIRLPYSGPLATSENVDVVARQAEKQGWDTLWCGGHIAWGRDCLLHFTHGTVELCEELGPKADPNFFEAFTTLAYVAGVTRRIRLSTSVLPLPMYVSPTTETGKYTPVLLALKCAVLDQLSGGRFRLGLGLGTLKEEYDRVYLPFKKRAGLVDEGVKCLRTLWTQPKVTFNGKYYKFRDVELYPHPKHPIPILIHSSGDIGIHRAARLPADGWIMDPRTPEDWASPSQFVRESLSKLKAAAKEYGTSIDLSKFEFISQFRDLCIAKTTSEAKKISARTSVMHLPEHAPKGFPPIYPRPTIAGTPKEVTAFLKPFVAAGIDHIFLRFVCQSFEQLLDMMELFAAEVMPSFT